MPRLGNNANNNNNNDNNINHVVYCMTTIICQLVISAIVLPVVVVRGVYERHTDAASGEDRPGVLRRSADR